MTRSVGLRWALILLTVLSEGLLASEASLLLSGPQVQGGLVVGRTEPGSQVRLDGRPIKVSDQGVFLLGFGRDAGEHAALDVTYPDGTLQRHSLNIEPRQYRIQRIDGLPPRKVIPSEKDLERIRRENSLVHKARARLDERTDFLQGFIWPAHGRISGVYGSQRILNGQPRRPHFGVDIAGPIGKAVVAPAAGIVTLTHNDMFFSGGTLIIDHGLGLSSSFLHLSRILVREGERVERGDRIAEIGATGRASGPHLDWRMNVLNVRIDPQLLVGEMPAAAER